MTEAEAARLLQEEGAAAILARMLVTLGRMEDLLQSIEALLDGLIDAGAPE